MLESTSQQLSVYSSSDLKMREELLRVKPRGYNRSPCKMGKAGNKLSLLICMYVLLFHSVGTLEHKLGT